MDVKTAIQQFMQLQAKLSAYQHAMSLIFYDGVTSAPKESRRRQRNRPIRP